MNSNEPRSLEQFTLLGLTVKCMTISTIETHVVLTYF